MLESTKTLLRLSAGPLDGMEVEWPAADAPPIEIAFTLGQFAEDGKCEKQIIHVYEAGDYWDEGDDLIQPYQHSISH